MLQKRKRSGIAIGFQHRGQTYETDAEAGEKLIVLKNLPENQKYEVEVSAWLKDRAEKTVFQKQEIELNNTLEEAFDICLSDEKVENLNEKGDHREDMGKRTGKNRKTDGRAGYGKRVAAVGMMFVMLFSFAACGKTTASEEAEALSGSCIDILNKVYETADLDASMRDAMQDYEMTTIDADMEEYVLGTDEITYTDSAYSAPMMTSVAYQCVVLRVPDGTDVPKAKQTLLDNANPAKWICVEAESVAVESIGDVILYVMGFDEDVSAIKDAFLALDE